MKWYKIMFTVLFLFSGFKLQAQIVAGTLPLGYHLNTVNYSVNVTCASGGSYLMGDLDCDTAFDVQFHFYPQCLTATSFWFKMQNLDTTIMIGYNPNIYPAPTTLHLAYGDTIGQNLIGGAWGGYASYTINSAGMSLCLCNPVYNLVNAYIPFRKKYNDKYLYGWIKVSSGNSAGPGGNLYSEVISNTILPNGYTELSDTITCQSNYTFSDGTSLSNVMQDTVYNAIFPSSVAGCDSLVRTRLTVLPSSIAYTNDTTYTNTPYTFLDGATISYATPGLYTHNNIFTGSGGCDSTIITTLKVYLQLHGSPSFQTMAVCHGSLVNLTGNIVGGTAPVTRSWSPVTGLSSTTGNTTSFTADSDIMYILTAIDSLGNVVIDTFNIIVDTALAAPFITSQFPTFCSDSMWLFSNNNLLGNWKKFNSPSAWVPNSPNDFAVNTTIYSEGKYAYVKSNACGTVTDTITVTPAVTVFASSTSNALCAGNSVTLTGGGSGATSYSWTGGVTDNMPFIPTSTQTYTVTGTNANGCLNTSSTTITVYPMPVLPATITASDDSICGQGTGVILTLYPTNAYCIPTVNLPGANGSYISKIDFNGGVINNTTGDGPGDYNYYPTPIANVIAGMNYNLFITGNAYVRNVWIDYNGDGDFDDIGEFVWQYTGTALTTGVSLTIPNTATNGITRMRIGTSDSSIISSCNNSSHGEYEDYQIKISGITYLNINWIPSALLNGLAVGNTVTTNNLTATTNFTATVTTIDGCVDSTDITITVSPEYNYSYIDTICRGGSYTFPDLTTFNNIQTPMVHTSYLSTQSGCDSTIYTTLLIDEIDVTLSQTDIVLKANALNVSYQWYDCITQTILPGDTNQSFTASQNGLYAAIISNGNCSDTSVCYTISGVFANGISNIDKQHDFMVYPNPASTKLYIRIRQGAINTSKKLKIELYDAIGQLVYSSYSKPRASEIEIDITGLSSGIYYLKYNGVSKKVIKE